MEVTDIQEVFRTIDSYLVALRILSMAPIITCHNALTFMNLK